MQTGNYSCYGIRNLYGKLQHIFPVHSFRRQEFPAGVNHRGPSLPHHPLRFGYYPVPFPGKAALLQTGAHSELQKLCGDTGILQCLQLLRCLFYMGTNEYDASIVRGIPAFFPLFHSRIHSA